ncbi:hypothetical protein EASAB2608_06546 [Streptomyces sp. EAS-AB2608]|nr:hypothetical protein EASAB2608_06546 [Streptomyces sp. EAS-AB2608]
MAARVRAVDQQPPGLFPADRRAPFARYVAGAAMDLHGRPADPDTEFHDPLRRCRLRPPAALLLGLPLHQLRDLAVDA